MAIKSPSGLYVAYVEDSSERLPEVIWGWGKTEQEALKNANAAEDDFGLQMDIEPEIYGVSQDAAKFFTGKSRVKKFKGNTFKIANGILDLTDETNRGERSPKVFSLPQDLQKRIYEIAYKVGSKTHKGIKIETKIKNDKIYIKGKELGQFMGQNSSWTENAANAAGEAVCTYIEDEFPNKPLGGLKCITKPAGKGLIYPNTCVIKVYHWPQ
jgi:hypothetical protein